MVLANFSQLSATQSSLADILHQHRYWLDTRGLHGCPADLHGADLRGVDLRQARLAKANLRGADLSGANFSGSFLAGANNRGGTRPGGFSRRRSAGGGYGADAGHAIGFLTFARPVGLLTLFRSASKLTDSI